MKDQGGEEKDEEEEEEEEKKRWMTMTMTMEKKRTARKRRNRKLPSPASLPRASSRPPRLPMLYAPCPLGGGEAQGRIAATLRQAKCDGCLLPAVGGDLSAEPEGYDAGKVWWPLWVKH